MSENNQTAAEEVTRDKLAADLKLVVSDAEELLRATASQAGERVAAARAKIEQSLKSARGRLVEAEQAVADSAKAAARATDKYVHDNPWKAVGVAAGAGFLLGLLVNRR